MNIQNLTDDETQTDEWEKIKDWAGGANKQAKHPLAQELERVKRRTPQKMDEGGVAGDDPTKLLQEIAPPGTGTLTPSPARPPMPPPQAPPMAQTPPPAPAPVQTPPPAATAQSAPVPAPTDASYDKQASGILGGITPDTISQLMQSLNQSNAKGQIGAGIAGIGDAIAKGVGRVDQNRMGETETNLKNRQEQALKAPEMMTALGKERYGLSEQLQAKDPNSPYSKVNQATYGSTLTQMGLSKAQISKMPASLISDLLSKKITLEDALAKINLEGTIRKGELGIQQQGVDVRKAEMGQKGEEIQDKALEEATKHPLLHPINAWKANQALAKEGGVANQEPPTINSQAEYDALPSGTPYVDSQGNQAVKK
jgi:hypothetical protein